MAINWEETSWGSFEAWRVEASDWVCPVANEYHGELPSSKEAMIRIYGMFCEKNCSLFTTPSPPWECCPFGQQMAEELNNG